MRAIVLTPQMTGADGVSEMSRQVVAALEAQVGVLVRAVDVFSLHDHAAPKGLNPAIRVHPARSSRMAFASSVVGLAAAADSVVIVLHLHLLPVMLLAMCLGARVVPVLLGIEAWKPLNGLQRLALRRAWRVAAISQHTIDRFRAANPKLARLAIRVCHPGHAAPQGTSSLTVPKSPDGVQKPPCALIVGRMASAERYKGHDELLEIWPRVRDAVPGATLVIAGGGDDRPRLAARAEALGVGAEVRFEGVVPAERLTQLYRDAAIFVMPSANEGFGLVFVEAMRAGTPCIAAAGAAEEIVDHGVTGLIVPPRDRDALARAVIELLTDPARRLAMGRMAADTARRRFSASAFAGRLYELLDMDQDGVSAVTATEAAC